MIKKLAAAAVLAGFVSAGGGVAAAGTASADPSFWPDVPDACNPDGSCSHIPNPGSEWTLSDNGQWVPPLLHPDDPNSPGNHWDNNTFMQVDG
ncbi:hypothetical protein [Nocardia terpenica]|uniref:Uncharacterized protein n=1 Tax=Nocardia terpenica TaxID=455432 RepID=A0A6G9ZE44_9NOCA|nr:hypothetical protein [Nocardia terpenica]QIS23617.1 hypothetical protein F6W96_40475 [Nocardia terpenica]